MSVEKVQKEILSRRELLVESAKVVMYVTALIVSGGALAIQVQHTNDVLAKMKKPNSGFLEVDLTRLPFPVPTGAKVYIAEDVEGFSTKAVFVLIGGIAIGIAGLALKSNEPAIEVRREM